MVTKSPALVKGSLMLYQVNNSRHNHCLSQEKNQLNILMRQSINQMSPLPRQPVIKISPTYTTMHQEIPKRETTHSAVVMRTPIKKIERQTFFSKRNEFHLDNQQTASTSDLAALPELVKNYFSSQNVAPSLASTAQKGTASSD